MASNPYFILTGDQYNSLVFYLNDLGYSQDFIQGLLADFAQGNDGNWYGNYTNMEPEELEFMDLLAAYEVYYNVDDFTDSVMAALMGP